MSLSVFKCASVNNVYLEISFQVVFFDHNWEKFVIWHSDFLRIC